MYGREAQLVSKHTKVNLISFVEQAVLLIITILCIFLKLRENAVTSCSKCNNRKGSLKPSEIRHVGMQVRQKPRVPTHFELAKVAGKMLPRRVHPTWIPYLGMSYQPSTVVMRSREEEDMFFEEA
jgi:hypothetical protein